MHEEQAIVRMHSGAPESTVYTGRESVTLCAPKSDMRGLGFLNRQSHKESLFFSSE